MNPKPCQCNLCKENEQLEIIMGRPGVADLQRLRLLLDAVPSTWSATSTGPTQDGRIRLDIPVEGVTEPIYLELIRPSLCMHPLIDFKRLFQPSKSGKPVDSNVRNVKGAKSPCWMIS